MAFIFHVIHGIIRQPLTFIFFRGVGQPPTRKAKHIIVLLPMIPTTKKTKSDRILTCSHLIMAKFRHICWHADFGYDQPWSTLPLEGAHWL